MKKLFIVSIIIVPLILFGRCSKKKSTGPELVTDVIPPVAITDLTTLSPTSNSITLAWTAPGDDSSTGTASQYDIRYSTSSIIPSNWSSAIRCSGEPKPKPVGSSETFVVNGLDPNTTYFFAIKTADEASNWSGLSNVVCDTTWPQATIELIGYIDVVGYADWPVAVFVSGNYAYMLVSGYTNPGIKIIDVSSPSKPTLTGTYDDITGFPTDIFVSGNYAYVAGERQGLLIIDISNPSRPTLIGSYMDQDSSWPEAVFVSENYAYVGAHQYMRAPWWSGLQILDVSNPSNPILTGTCDTRSWPSDVFVSGNYAYVSGGYGMEIIDISNASNPTLTGFYGTPGYPRRVFVSGSYAYVADGEEGLSIINISNPSNPTITAILNTPGEAYDVFVSGNYAYVADEEWGLQIINLSNPYNPALASFYITLGWARAVFVSQNYIYVADGEVGLLILRFVLQEE
jgi:hypothetical protein